MATLKAEGLGKTFFGNRALGPVSFEAHSGEIIALMGENGAGKSTLMKILSGVYPHGDFEGRFFLEGRELSFSSPRQASDAGIAMIHQELNVFGSLSVADNLSIGREGNDRCLGILKRADRDGEAAEIQNWWASQQLGEMPAMNLWMENLSAGEQQKIEIAKALMRQATVFIFDEPTSSLSLPESQVLFAQIRRLKEQGKIIFYISHRMEEVFALADRILVLRDGALVGEQKRSSFEVKELIREMVGRSVDQLFPKLSPPGHEEILHVENLDFQSPRMGLRSLRRISFSLKRGEILGISGLVGSGRSEVLKGLMGALPAGTVTLDAKFCGEKLAIQQPGRAWNTGLSYLPEDRKREGLLLSRSCDENMSLACLSQNQKGGFLLGKKLQQLWQRLAEKLRVKTSSPLAEISSLSGGNQQKILLGRCLTLKPKVLLLDEPTRGVDIGAKQEIYRQIAELASEGVAVLMVSSDLPEVLNMSHRLLVLSEGTLAGELLSPQATQEKVMHLASGLGDAS